MKRLLSCTLLILLSLAVSMREASAQSWDFFDSLLANEVVTVGQASYLVLLASDRIGEEVDQAQAFELVGSLWGLPQAATIDGPVSLAAYSWMLMRAFDLKGGIMYGLLPGPRYAYRVLGSLQVIQGLSDPASPVDGETAIRMLGMAIDLAGGRA